MFKGFGENSIQQEKSDLHESLLLCLTAHPGHHVAQNANQHIHQGQIGKQDEQQEQQIVYQAGISQSIGKQYNDWPILE